MMLALHITFAIIAFLATALNPFANFIGALDAKVDYPLVAVGLVCAALCVSGMIKEEPNNHRACARISIPGFIGTLALIASIICGL